MKTKRCKTCGRVLDNSKPLSLNLGGNCVECVAKAGDPEAIAYLEKVKAAA